MATNQAKHETSKIKQQAEPDISPEMSVSYLAYCSNLKIGDICSSETFIYLRTTRHYNPQGRTTELPPGESQMQQVRQNIANASRVLDMYSLPIYRELNVTDFRYVMPAFIQICTYSTIHEHPAAPVDVYSVHAAPLSNQRIRFRVCALLSADSVCTVYELLRVMFAFSPS